MISNITNTLPSLLKNLKENVDNPEANLKFNLVETMKFYSSILPIDKSMSCLKHMYLDFRFTLRPEFISSIDYFTITLDTLPFLKDFEYDINKEDGYITIRSSYEELAILSLILIGSIKSLPSDENNHNKSLFISLAFHFLSSCIENGYNVCKIDDIKVLEDYNKGFDKMFESISYKPTSEDDVGTIHFVGIELNKDILIIFEKYKNVNFTYNPETASFIISMPSKYWDDFWNNAPKYLIDEYSPEEYKNSYLGNK